MTGTYQHYRVRAARFYKKYAPEKLPGLDDTLQAWDCPDTRMMKKMIQAMIDKYGPEPSGETDSDDDDDDERDATLVKPSAHTKWAAAASDTSSDEEEEETSSD